MKTHAEAKASTSSRTHAMPVPNALAHQAQLRSALLRAGVQPRLEIGAVNDPLEREADAAAERVMRMSEPQTTQETLVQRKASAAPSTQASPQLESSLNSLNSGGTPLDTPSRAFFEPRFGQDFSQVRLHTDPHAAQMAESLNAKAFTLGTDIAFAPNQYSAHTPTGQNLLGHELAHVVQQRGLDGGMMQAKLIQCQEKAPALESPDDKAKVTGGAIFPYIQIGSKEWRLKFNADLNSVNLGYARPHQWIGLKYKYGNDFNLSLMTDKIGASMAVNPGTGKITAGMQWSPLNNLTMSGTINSSGAVTVSFAYRLFSPHPKSSSSPLDGPTPVGNILIPLVKPVPGGGITFQSTEEIFRAGVNSAQSMLPELPGIVRNPALISRFISAHSSTPDGEKESDFTKIGNTANAVSAIANQQKNTFDVQVRLDIAVDPTYGAYGIINFVIAGW